MTSQIFVSVVRAWRFADDEGRIAVTHDKKRHSELIHEIHGGGRSDDPFRLPWPPFRSLFWEHHLRGREYRSKSPRVLVPLLVPRRALLHIDYDRRHWKRTPIAEVFVEPFGVWTALTIDVTKDAPGEWTDDAVAGAIEDALRTHITLASQPLERVRDGIDARAAEAALAAVPWQEITRLDDAGTLTLISGLSPADADMKKRAISFRTQFTGVTGGTTHELTRSTGASSTTTTEIGITLADTTRRSPAKVKCLHHNHTLLAGHLLTFGALMRPEPRSEATAYQKRAARVLNHLFRGKPLPEAGIYKSRVAPAWIEAARLITPINEVTAGFAEKPPDPLAPAPPPRRGGGGGEDG